MKDNLININDPSDIRHVVALEDIIIARNTFSKLLLDHEHVVLTDLTSTNNCVDFRGNYLRIKMDHVGENLVLTAYLAAYGQAFEGEYELTHINVHLSEDFRERLVAFTKILLSIEGFTELDTHALENDLINLSAKGVAFTDHEPYMRELLIFTKAVLEAKY